MSNEIEDLRADVEALRAMMQAIAPKVFRAEGISSDAVGQVGRGLAAHLRENALPEGASETQRASLDRRCDAIQEMYEVISVAVRQLEEDENAGSTGPLSV